MDQRDIAFLERELKEHEHDLLFVKHPQTRKEIKQKIKLIKEVLKTYGYPQKKITYKLVERSAKVGEWVVIADPNNRLPNGERVQIKDIIFDGVNPVYVYEGGQLLEGEYLVLEEKEVFGS